MKHIKRISQFIRVKYLKSIKIKKILRTEPVQTERNLNFSLHTLVCEKDFWMSLWSLKSFYYYSGLKPELIIHDDGSLSEKSKKIYLIHFRGCRIIERKKADTDLQDSLTDYKFSSDSRKLRNFYCSLKLFDNFHYCSNKYLLHLDPDILFFKKPSEILDHIKHNKSFFMSDYQDSYSYDSNFLNDKFHIKIKPAINAGMIYMSKREHYENRDLIETYFEEISGLNYTGLVNRHEQTLNALILSKSNATRLSTEYQISDQPITDKTTSAHFVSDGTDSRYNLYTIGLKRLASDFF